MNFEDYSEIIKIAAITKEMTFKRNRWEEQMQLVSVGETDLQTIRVPMQVKAVDGELFEVNSIASNAFKSENIMDIILHSGITNISPMAFAGCKALKNITIPRGVKKIDEATFDGCVNLQNIYYEGTPEEWKEIVIVHERHEIEFGDLIPGRPVQKIKAERMINVPGNEAIFSANIHFRCDLDSINSYTYNANPGDITIETSPIFMIDDRLCFALD